MSLGLLLIKDVAYAPVLFLAALLVDLFIYGAAKSIAATFASERSSSRKNEVNNAVNSRSAGADTHTPAAP